MKNIVKKYLYCFLFLSLLGVVSCSDALDLEQKEDATEDIVFETVEDLQLGLNAVYIRYGIDNCGNGVGDAIWFNSIFTDNVRKGKSNAGQGKETYQLILESISDSPRRIWNNRYATINYANRVLRGAEKVQQTITNSEEQSRFDNIKAQLLAWRAISHYDIFMYYTTNYTDLDALSAIISDYVPEISDKPFRSNVGEVVSFIKKDLDDAKSLIDPATNDPSRINPDVIDAFRAKLALAISDYDTAGTIAQELLAKYPLATRSEYVDLFKDLGSKELIFELIRKRVINFNGIANSWYNSGVSSGGNPWFYMSEQLYNLYSQGDVRIDEVLLHSTSDVDTKMFLIGKYPGRIGDPLRNNVKVIRSSEMAFILAETKARAGDLSGAAATLQDLINIRYAPNPVPSTENVSFSNINDALSRILLERRKELCFEGHRYLDLKRFGAGFSRLPSDAKTFSFTTPTDLPAGDYRFTLPIPQAEINGNRNAVQNNGYTNN